MKAFLPVKCTQTNCPLYPTKQGVPAEVCLGEANQTKILFVGEAPGKDEIKHGAPFIGRSGTLLRKVLAYTGGQDAKDSIAFSNMIRCYPADEDGETRPPNSDEIDYCKQHLESDIAKIDPALIVLMGKTALQLVPGAEGITSQRGKVRSIFFAGKDRKVFLTWHPAFVLRETRVLPLFIKDISFAFALARGQLESSEYTEKGKSTALKTPQEVEGFVDHCLYELTENDDVALDTEARNLNRRYGNQLGTLQFAHDIDNAFVIPYDVHWSPWTSKEPGEAFLRVHNALVKLFTAKPNFRYWITHFGKFEQQIIATFLLKGKPFRNRPMVDTGAGMYLLDENRVGAAKEIAMAGDDDGLGPGVLGLKRLAKEFLLYDHYDRSTLASRESACLLDLTEQELVDYGGMDSYVTLRLFHWETKEAIRQKYFKKWIKLLEELFSRVYRLNAVMERNGLYTHLDYLHVLAGDSSPINERLVEIENELRKLPTVKEANKSLALKVGGGMKSLFGTPWVFDISDKQHKIELLCEQCKLQPLSYGKKGIPNIDKAFWSEYAPEEGEGGEAKCVEAELTSEHVKLKKLKSASINQMLGFVDPVFGNIDSQDSRIRMNQRFENTVTGRATQHRPSLHQIPRNTNWARAAIKAMFQAENREFFEWLKKQLGGTLHFRYKRGEIPKPPEGLIKYCLVQLDFMSAEIRWWAIISQCPELAKGFIQGKAYRDAYRADPTNKEKSKLAKLAGDSHLNTAALMFQIAIDFVTKYQRQAAKNIAFGRIFKRTVEAIAEQLKNDNIAEVTALVNRFDKQFPRGNEWLNEIEQIAKTNLEVISPFGRKRRLVGYITEDRTICSENDRLARNQPIQGGSSDAAFFGASLMNDYILDNDKDWKIENSVHDSCLIECPIIELVEVLQVAEHMFTTETMKETARIWGIKYNVPLECEFEIGLNYGQLKKWDYSITQLAEIKQWLLEGAPAEDKKKN